MGDVTEINLASRYLVLDWKGITIMVILLTNIRENTENVIQN